jgi:glycosyltransferase involved in cell wall biosynthesis
VALPALPRVPLVSAVVTAYNVEAYIGAAIDSALAVNWPMDKLEIIVVNDGSTDNTGAILASYGDRIRLITQENKGCLAAMTSALRAVRGQVIAFLDGDDEWPRDKLKNQVSVLQRRPEVGLVYGDMEIVDTVGEVTHPSYFAHKKITPLRGRILGSLLPGSFVLTGAIVVRADLLALFCPVPWQAAAYDWYVASRVAEVAEIDYVQTCVSRYRYRGNNLYLGAGVEQQCANDVRGDVFTRYLLTNLDLSTVTTGQMMLALRSAETRRKLVARIRGVSRACLEITSVEAHRSARKELTQARTLLASGNVEAAMRAAIRSSANEPANRAPIEFLENLTERMFVGAPAATLPTHSQPLELRGAAVLADASELVARPELLLAWAGTFSDLDDVSLVALARPEDHDRIAAALQDQLSQSGVDDDRAPDIVLQACSDPTELAVDFAAFYGRSSDHVGGPAFDYSTLKELRAWLAS